MDEQPQIVLIPRMPEKFFPDVVFGVGKAFAVHARVADLQALKAEGIPAVTLYASAQEYQTAVFNLNRDQALAALTTRQNEAIAALDPADRDKFSV
jgi:hypothetical protein